jgi:hypothetical protein
MTAEKTCVVCGARLTAQPRMGRPSNTCSDTCRVVRKRARNEKSRQRAIADGCPPDKHGTSTGYSHFRCSCDACRTWARLYKRERRRAHT